MAHGRIYVLAQRFFGKQESRYRWKVLLVIQLSVLFLIGMAAGFGVFHTMLYRLSIDEQTNSFFSYLTMVGMGVGWAGSINIRCTSCLLVPALFTKQGRFYVSSIGYEAVLTGPISSIATNAGLFIDSIKCSFKVAEEAVRERIDDTEKRARERLAKRRGYNVTEQDSLMIKALQQFDNQLIDLFYEVEKIGITYKPEEGEGEVGSSAVSEKEAEELEKSCLETLLTSQTECRKQFNLIAKRKSDEANGLCNGKLRKIKYTSYARALITEQGVTISEGCPQLADFMFCPPPITEEQKQACTFKNRDFSPASDEASNIEESVSIETEETPYPRNPNQISRSQVTVTAEHEFNRKKQWIDLLSLTFSTMLKFLFLLIIKAAYRYNTSYLTNLEFDNTYISDYFLKINKRRLEQGKSVILPLRSHETKEMIPEYSLRLTAAEKKKLTVGVIVWFEKMIVITLLVFLDITFYEAVSIVQNDGQVTEIEKGLSEQKVYVDGTGEFAKLVKFMYRDYNYSYYFNEIYTNKHCLPVAVKTGNYPLIYSTFCVELLLVMFNAYGLRARRFIAAFFYRKREKKRILFKYNDLLKRRLAWLQHARHTVRRNIIDGKAVDYGPSPLARLLSRFKTSKGKLANLKAVKCLVCELKLGPEDQFGCLTESCETVKYCETCWKDIKRLCLVCTRPDILDKRLSDLTDMGAPDGPTLHLQQPSVKAVEIIPPASISRPKPKSSQHNVKQPLQSATSQHQLQQPQHQPAQGLKQNSQPAQTSVPRKSLTQLQQQPQPQPQPPQQPTQPSPGRTSVTQKQSSSSPPAPAKVATRKASKTKK